jgi:hypothetical protein
VLVDEDAHPPVPLGHHLGGVGDHRDLQPGDVGALDLTLSNVEHEGDTTEVVRRTVIEREVARTHQLAAARLDVAAVQAP